MIKIERKTIDSMTEQQITTAMITSTKFLSEVRQIFNPDYIRSSFSRIICFWCADYFDKYRIAPGMHIKDIYLVECEKGVAKEDSDLIAEFLKKLSDQYSESQAINSDYVRDSAYSYFRKRELEIRVAKAQQLLSVDRVDDADKEISKYRTLTFHTSGWFNPFDHKEMLEVFDDNDEGIFHLPGALGKVVGPIERDWFVAVLAPFKRGKSFFLQEMAVRALFQGLRVIFISLEMKKKNLKERFYRRLTAQGSKRGDDVFLFPTWDCKLNQDGTCTNPNRLNRNRLLRDDGSKPEFDVDLDYRPCSYCRENLLHGYKTDTWFETMEVPQFTLKGVRGHLDATKIQYGDNIRYIAYPRFMAGIEDIRRDLDIIEQFEGFIPDLVIIDYADILKLGSGDKRNAIDDVWKMLASIAAERHCIMFSASQGTRGSIYKSDMSQDDLAEWIGKLAHVDAFLGLNQTPGEKESKIIRVNALVHRHKEVDEKVAAMLLQQLEVGQFAMDSEMTRRG